MTLTFVLLTHKISRWMLSLVYSPPPCPPPPPNVPPSSPVYSLGTPHMSTARPPVVDTAWWNSFPSALRRFGTLSGRERDPSTAQGRQGKCTLPVWKGETITRVNNNVLLVNVYKISKWVNKLYINSIVAVLYALHRGNRRWPFSFSVCNILITEEAPINLYPSVIGHW